MSSVPKPPAPPPPPPPPLLTFPNQRNSDLVNLGNGGQSVKKEEHKSYEGPQGLGQLEIKDITEEKFLAEVGELISNRLVGDGEDDIQNGNEEPVTGQVKLVVAAPLRKAILQSGPMCGIVALAEALQILNGEHVNPKEILEEAIKVECTKQGEMFSIAAMLSLAEKFGKCIKSRILKTENNTGQFTDVVTHILEGCPVLVPYDADYNHSPSLRKGHAAHWAVIYGLASYIPLNKVELLMKMTPEVFTVLQSSPDMIIVKPSSKIGNGNASFFSEELLNLFSYESLHVIAQQGKSFHTALWKYTNLMESNQNLKEIAPKILANKSEFICENIVDGLCSKILLIK